MTALRHLLGEANRPIEAALCHITPIIAERRFAEPIARTEYAIEVLASMAAENSAADGGTGIEGGRQFEALFFRSDGLVRRIAIRDQPIRSRDPTLAMRLFNRADRGLSDPIDPGFGFDLIRLSVPRDRAPRRHAAEA